MAQALTIVGGGPAGLACGIRLREQGWSVTVHERGRYPLKKVCGEFLSPKGWQSLRNLGADRYLPFAPRTLRRARFYADEKNHVDFNLDPPAWGLRRSALDTALAMRFRALGGRLEEGSDFGFASGDPEVLDARGRSLEKHEGPWMAWKGYLSAADAPPEMGTLDLIMLPVDQGYAGLAWMDDGSLSVCLIARRTSNVARILRSHALLSAVAPRLKAHTAIAGFSLTAHTGGRLLGDRRRVWPPLVGDGIHRALASGEAKAREYSHSAPAAQILDLSRVQFALAMGLHHGMLHAWTRRLGLACLRIGPGLATGLYRCTRV